MEKEIIIRKITAGDDAKLASIIRTSLEDFGAVKQGTVYFDESTDRLHEVFQKERSAYFVIEINGEVCGGGGFYPTEGLPVKTCVSLPDRMALKLHLTVCKTCPKFENQVLTLRAAMARWRRVGDDAPVGASTRPNSDPGHP